MKKIILMFAALVAFSISASAQLTTGNDGQNYVNGKLIRDQTYKKIDTNSLLHGGFCGNKYLFLHNPKRNKSIKFRAEYVVNRSRTPKFVWEGTVGPTEWIEKEVDTKVNGYDPNWGKITRIEILEVKTVEAVPW